MSQTNYTLAFNNLGLLHNNSHLLTYDTNISLPTNTLRLLYTDGVTPVYENGYGVQVSVSPNIWDWTNTSTIWYNWTLRSPDLLEVLGGNTTNVTYMEYLFYNCPNLTNVVLFDTSNVVNMDGMFLHCTSLTTVPQFDTSNVQSMISMFSDCTSLISVPQFDMAEVTNIDSMFYNCKKLEYIPLFNTTKVTNCDNTFKSCLNVESGALALYQHLNEQVIPPSNHSQTFRSCGTNTVTGAAELAQIPADWK